MNKNNFNSNACYLYSRVNDLSLIGLTGFYSEDIFILNKIFYKVVATNKLSDIFSGKPEIILCYFYSYSLFAAIIVRLFGGRVYFTGGADNLHPICEKNNFKRIRNLVFAFLCLFFCHAVITCSETDRAVFERLCFGLGFLKRKIKLLPHSIPNLDLLLSNAIDNVERDKYSALTICWMGAPENAIRKGLFETIKFLSLLRSAGIDIKLTIIGTPGPATGLITAYARDLQFLQNVKFTGACDEEEKLALLRSNRFYFQLSSYEGFGVAALEALFAGCVVVHSGRGGLGENIHKLGIEIDKDAIPTFDASKALALWKVMESFTADVQQLKCYASKFSTQNRLIGIAEIMGVNHV